MATTGQHSTKHRPLVLENSTQVLGPGEIRCGCPKMEQGARWKCACCRKDNAIDSITHFVLNCQQPDLVKIRKGLEIRRVISAVKAVAGQRSNAICYTIYQSLGDEGEGLVTLVLGGQLRGAETKAPALVGEPPGSRKELFNRACGKAGWAKAECRLLVVCFVGMARYLQAAMPIRNKLLFANSCGNRGGRAFRGRSRDKR